MLARQVYARLTEGDTTRSDSKRASNIDWKPYGRSLPVSPVTDTAMYCIENFGDAVGGSAINSFQKNALTWFLASYNEEHTEDVKRQRMVHLEEEGWRFLRSVLVADKCHYTDALKPKRRFSTLGPRTSTASIWTLWHPLLAWSAWKLCRAPVC